MLPKIKREVVDEILMRTNKSLGWLADTAKIDQSYLTRLLGGERSPSPVVRENLMKALKITDWDELFEIKED